MRRIYFLILTKSDDSWHMCNGWEFIKMILLMKVYNWKFEIYARPPAFKKKK